MCIWNVSTAEDRLCNVCKVPNCIDRKRATRKGIVFPTLMHMSINKYITFSIDKYNAVRTAICYLRKDYNMDFRYNQNKDFIVVTRVK